MSAKVCPTFELKATGLKWAHQVFLGDLCVFLHRAHPVFGQLLEVFFETGFLLEPLSAFLTAVSEDLEVCPRHVGLQTALAGVGLTTEQADLALLRLFFWRFTCK